MKFNLFKKNYVLLQRINEAENKEWSIRAIQLSYLGLVGAILVMAILTQIVWRA